MSAICRKSWPNMLAISTIGARIDRWDNGRPAHREQARLIEALKLERSSRYLCSEGFITFISKPHDDDGSNSCALQGVAFSTGERRCLPSTPIGTPICLRLSMYTTAP